MDCLFCNIAKKEIPSNIIYEDEKVVAFEDINPQAPTHTLIIPRKHIETVNQLSEEDDALIGYCVRIAQKIAKDKSISEPGYRLVFNCNNHGGQVVFHIHLHLLGGRQMTWPPG